ncbi:MAG: SDR family NAD(P)-dependent oxidoreductase [Actinomycetota bacterium]|jgi:decaprenylphospho-beta-D-erythro-pentofuranosid-2-ulose 2-reductase|nr:SDR family NAD(P)-dependent oxidoreductase [Actinomycetota bacterium]
MNDAFGRPQSMVVLAGTSEIARAVVRRALADRCRTVVLAGRNPAALAVAAGEAVAAGADAVPTVLFDACDPAGARDAVDRCFAAAGGDVDAVVMAVGELGDQRTDETDPERTAAVLTVNFTWPATAMVAVAAHLRAQGHGRLVVLSSVAGVRVRRANFVYGSSKAGLDAFSVGLGEALRGSGAGVTVVRPGFVRTKMTLGRPEAPFATTPDVVARAITDGLGSGAAVVWAPGLLRWVFAVLKNLPTTIWRRLPG